MWDLCRTKWHWGTFSPSTWVFPCQFSFHRLINTRHLSSRAGTIDQLVAEVPSGLSLTPPQESEKENSYTRSWIGGNQYDTNPVYVIWNRTLSTFSAAARFTETFDPLNNITLKSVGLACIIIFFFEWTGSVRCSRQVLPNRPNRVGTCLLVKMLTETDPITEILCFRHWRYWAIS
jgi:hypothetical protein